MAPRVILHVDMDAFYAAVEVHRRPELAGRPVVVGGTGRRGVVASASYEARWFGVHSAQPTAIARRRCPQAAFLDGDHAHYGEVSTRIMEVFRSFTPLVEPLSLDEAFLDATGARRHHPSAATLAQRIRDAIADQEGLACSVGAASTKFVAKLASEDAKPRASAAGPVGGLGVRVVTPDETLEYLRPLPVTRLWGVGPATRSRLESLGIATVDDLAEFPAGALTRAIGDAAGQHLQQLAHGIDPREVIPDQPLKSVGHEETFAIDIRDREVMAGHLVRLADRVAARLRHHGLAGRTITIKVRQPDFTTRTRSVTVAQPTDSGGAIARHADGLLDRVDTTDGVRLLGVSVSSLSEHAPVQLTLDDATGAGKWRRADKAVDDVRERFGSDAIGPASVSGRPRTDPTPWGPSA